MEAMSLASWPLACPRCGNSDEFREIGRIEAGEFADGSPLTDMAVYACNCGHEWEQ
jgi:hypothetical protein